MMPCISIAECWFFGLKISLLVDGGCGCEIGLKPLRPSMGSMDWVQVTYHSRSRHQLLFSPPFSLPRAAK